MARAGTAIEQQRAGGSKFAFAPGLGEVTEATVAIETLGTWLAVGYRITVQRLDKNAKPTDDEPVTQFLPLASVFTREGEPLFQPGKAVDTNDSDPEPLGEADETEGNCLWAANEELKVDNTLGGSVFSASLQEHGFPAAKLNGYAPNFVGLKADFEQLELKKSANSQAKNAPTALVVKKILAMPGEKGKGTTAATGKGATAAAASAKPAGGKPNGAPAPATSDAIEGLAAKCLAKVAAKYPGETITRQKIGTFLTITMSKVGAKPGAEQNGIQALVANDGWFSGMAKDMDWVVDGDNVTIPAAAE